MSGAGKAAWRYTAPTALFFCGRFARTPRRIGHWYRPDPRSLV